MDGAQFVALSDCPSSSSPAGDVAEERALGRLSQFVRCDAAYRALIDWLLASWGVVENISHLLGRSTLPSGSWVTTSGEAWNGRGWQLAGRPADGGTRSFLLARRQRWERAQEALHALVQDVARGQEESKRAEAQWQQAVDEEARIRRQ